MEEYKKDPGSLWIVKPTASAQGKGIFLITKLQQIKKWAKDKWLVTDASSVPKDQYVISKYVENPMLIGGKKFDLRVYVLVTSYRPLRAYFHQVNVNTCLKGAWEGAVCVCVCVETVHAVPAVPALPIVRTRWVLLVSLTKCMCIPR